LIEAAIDAHQRKQPKRPHSQRKPQSKATAPSTQQNKASGPNDAPGAASGASDDSGFMTLSRLMIQACGLRVLTRTANASRPNGFVHALTCKP
jgi:hypothetical protein